ncbi:MAG: hypothetical protein PHW54_01520 [Candidatus Omnitrophica bacterium]|nr:hypothetical protein [Candidatus Omnitrophota bacterium]
MNWTSISIDEVLESYKTYLNVKYPGHLEALEQREKSNLDGVRFEAAIFSVARSYNLNPQIAEIIGEGGVDFLCSSNQDKFLIEVTHCNTESIEEKSGLSNTPTNGEAKFFSMITPKLQGKAKDKAEQMADYAMPRLLCIGATHTAATILLGKHAAKWLLTSETKISIPVGIPNAPISQTTELENSVFFKFDQKGEIVPCRQSISAILLVVLDNNSCLFVGLLHPQPAYPFDIDYFPDIPFLRMTNWGNLDGRITTEWTIADPSEKRVYLDKITLTDEELRKV